MNTPFSIGLETIAHCNAKCIMCPISLPGMPKGTMSDVLFAKIMDEVVTWGRRPVMSLHGTGEPTLFKRLVDRIRMIAERGIYSKLVTNGSLMDEDLCRAVLDAGVSNIEFSVESLDKEIYNKIRPGLDLETVLNNIISTCKLRSEKRPGVMISWIFIKHADNEASLQSVAEFFSRHSRRGDNMVVHPRHNFGGKFPNNGVEPSNTPCWQATDCVNVLFDGTVNMCCVDDDNTQIMGNVNQSTIAEIYNSDKYQRLINSHRTGNRHTIPVCASCNVPETSALHYNIAF